MTELKLEHLSIDASNPNECTAVVAIEPNVIEPNISGVPLLDAFGHPVVVAEYITLEVTYNVEVESAPCGMIRDRIIEKKWFYIESIQEANLKLADPYLEIGANVLLDTTQDGLSSFKIDMDILNELLLELLKNNEEILLKVEREE